MSSDGHFDSMSRSGHVTATSVRRAVLCRAPGFAIAAAGSLHARAVLATSAGPSAPGPSAPGDHVVQSGLDALRDRDDEEFSLPGTDGGFLRVWAPKGASAGVVLYLHGHLSDPRKQRRTVIRALLERDMMVVAPVFLDARRWSLWSLLDRGGTYDSRVVETAASVKWIDSSVPDLPASVLGYSYGSLFAMMLAGGFLNRRIRPWPRARAAACYSTPGAHDSIDRRDAADVDRPLLLITGTKDIVNGEPRDERQHTAYLDAVRPGLAWSAVVQGGAHELIDRTDLMPLHAMAADFLAWHMAGEGSGPRPPWTAPSFPRKDGRGGSDDDGVGGIEVRHRIGEPALPAG